MTHFPSTRLLRAGACFVLAALGLPSAASAQSATYERAIVTTGPGPQRLAVDADLLVHASPFLVAIDGARSVARNGLGDLRLMTADGRPVPHLLVYPPDERPAWRAGAILPVADTKETSGFEVDLGELVSTDLLHLDGLPAPYLKRVRLEGSGDRQHWTLLVAEGTLFDLPDEQHRQNALAFLPGQYRYLRVTWDDRSSGRVPAPAHVFARRLTDGASAPPERLPITNIERRPSEPGVTRFRLTLPAARLPIIALDLDVGGGHLYRRVEVSEAGLAGTEVTSRSLGGRMLARQAADAGAMAALRVAISPPREMELDIVVRDTGNEPLELRGVSAVLARLPWIYFEAPAAAVVARYGHSTEPPPVYDLEAARSTVMLATLPEARWGPAVATHPVAAAQALESGPAPWDPGTALDSSQFAFAAALPAEHRGAIVVLRLDPHVLAFSRGPGTRFGDVRLLDASNRQIPYLVERQDEVLPLQLTVTRAESLVAAATRGADGHRQSVYAFSLPYANLPAGDLVVDTGSKVFSRTVRVGFEHPVDRHTRVPWFDTTISVPWAAADERRAAMPLVTRFAPGPRTDWLMLVDDGDNAPVEVRTARFLLPVYRLRFRMPADGTVRLVYGQRRLTPPRYDLQLLAPRLMGARAIEVEAGPAAPVAAPAARPTFVTPTVFALLLGGAALALLLMIARLLRR